MIHASEKWQKSRRLTHQKQRDPVKREPPPQNIYELLLLGGLALPLVLLPVLPLAFVTAIINYFAAGAPGFGAIGSAERTTWHLSMKLAALCVVVALRTPSLQINTTSKLLLSSRFWLVFFLRRSGHGTRAPPREPPLPSECHSAAADGACAPLPRAGLAHRCRGRGLRTAAPLVEAGHRLTGPLPSC